MKNPLKILYKKAEKHFLVNADLQSLKVVAVAKGDTAPSRMLNYEAQTLQAQGLEEWKMAVMMATDPEQPDFGQLYKLIQNLMLDNHLASVIDSRILFCQRSPFKLVDEAGNKDEEATWLLERIWMDEFIRLTIMHRFQGRKLIELFDIDPVTKELSTVSEIPMPFFNARKGIITKEAGGQTGWDYKEGAYQPYYIQVGKDTDLGMLIDMAPIILAKKLGIGSMLDYIEKYGVPALFITTDREDNARLKELYDAASNFKSNGFMVGRGQEKFEIGKDSAGNTENFIKVAEFANDEVSKRILGGSGLTDEKSFVGAAEIQFRLAKDRFDSDKLYVKNVANKDLIPRLIKISPVYSRLKNRYFEWEEIDSSTPKETAELINILATNFELDTDEVSQKTGFKILGQKSNMAVPTAPTTEEVKKKDVSKQ